MKIALIAHDQKKKDLVNLVYAYSSYFEGHQLYSTGTTGMKIQEKINLPVRCFQAGPLGGDQEIGAMAGRNEIDMVIFFRDPLSVQPHEPDIAALMRLCDVYNIPLATNMGTAEILIRALERGNMEWRNIVHDNQGKEIAKMNLIVEGLQSLMPW